MRRRRLNKAWHALVTRSEAGGAGSGAHGFGDPGAAGRRAAAGLGRDAVRPGTFPGLGLRAAPVADRDQPFPLQYPRPGPGAALLRFETAARRRLGRFGGGAGGRRPASLAQGLQLGGDGDPGGGLRAAVAVPRGVPAQVPPDADGDHPRLDGLGGRLRRRGGDPGLVAIPSRRLFRHPVVEGDRRRRRQPVDPRLGGGGDPAAGRGRVAPGGDPGDTPGGRRPRPRFRARAGDPGQGRGL